MKKPQYHKCKNCKKVKLCQFGPDPYESDVNNDQTPVWLCDGCAEDLAMEI